MTAPRLLVRDGRETPPDAFLDLPGRVYAEDPCWIPEEPEAVVDAFDSGNPWFARGRAITVTLPGRTRAAGFLPGDPVDGRRAAFFGYWETVGEPADDAAVLGEVMRWAADAGAEALYGPIDFSTYGRYRLRLSAEPGSVPFPGEPYNPSDYPARLGALGFHLHRTYLSQLGPAPRTRAREKQPRVAGLHAAGYRFEPLTGTLWMRSLPELHELVDAIFGENFAYTPLDFDAFIRICGAPLADRMCPESSTIAYGPTGEIAGFLLVFPHYGPVAVQGAGTLRVAAGRLRYDRHLPALAARGPLGGIVKTAGVRPEHRGAGVLDALVVHMLRRAGDRYAHWQAALIRADNHSRRFADGAPGERWYGLYARPLSHTGVLP